MKSLWEISKYFQRRKRKKLKYSRERNKNLSEDEKQNLTEYRKKYYKIRKSALL